MRSVAPIWPAMLRICAVMLLCSLVAYQVWLIADRLLAPAVGRQLYCSLYRLLLGGYECHSWGWPAWSWLQIPATLTYLTAIVLLGAAGWTAMRARLNSHVTSLGWEPSTSPTIAAVELAIAGIAFTAGSYVFDILLGARVDPRAWYWWEVLSITAFLHVLPHFTTGCLVAVLLEARASVWIAGVLCITALASGRFAGTLELLDSDWYVLAIGVPGVLFIAAAVAVWYAINVDVRSALNAALVAARMRSKE